MESYSDMRGASLVSKKQILMLKLHRIWSNLNSCVKLEHGRVWASTIKICSFETRRACQNNFSLFEKCISSLGKKNLGTFFFIHPVYSTCHVSLWGSRLFLSFRGCKDPRNWKVWWGNTIYRVNLIKIRKTES